MKASESFREFSERFILANARERCIHEANKKPQRLLERVCHNAQELFDASLKGNRFKPVETDEYLLLSGKIGFVGIKGPEVLRRMGTGVGTLVISISGEEFYAETEATTGTPAVEYSGR